MKLFRMKHSGGFKIVFIVLITVLAFHVFCRDAYVVFAAKEMTEEEYSEIKADCIDKCSRAEKLIAECEEREFKVSYEKAYYQMMKMFTGYLDEEYADVDKQYRISEYASAVSEYYNKIEASLKGYLNGDVMPLEIPEYDLKTAEYDAEAGHFYAENSDGVRAPIMYMGYNAFRTPVDNTVTGASLFHSLAADLGFNFSANGIYLNQLITYDNTNKVFIAQADEGKKGENPNDPNAYWKKSKNQMRVFLQECRDAGITINMQFCTMSVIGNSEWENFMEPGKVYGFIKCNPTHPIMKLQIQKGAEEFIGLIKDYRDVVTTVCLTNEPSFQSYDKEYYIPFWKSYLEKKYGNITSLNAEYGLESGDAYTDFDEVLMPAEVEYTILYRDYREFNETIVPEFIQNIYDAMKSEMVKQGVEDIPLYTKQLMTIRTNNGEAYRRRGTNFEDFARILDINGTDSSAYMKSNLHYETRALWYDLLRSVKKAAIADTEMHVMWDLDASESGIVAYDENEPAWVYANMWQAAAHGVDQIALWEFGRDTPSQEKYYNTSFLLKPHALASASKASLDIRRLAKELTAIQDAKPSVALLWSNYSYTYNKDFFSSVNKAYYELITKGQRVEFVTENTIDNLSQHNILVVPNSVNVTRETLDKINEFAADAGNSLILLGEDSLTKNESNVAFAENLISETRKNAVTLPIEISDTDIVTIPEETSLEIERELKEKDKMKIVIKDADTGNTVKYTEWTAVEYGSKTLINVCNTNLNFNSVKTAEIYVDGEKKGKIRNLISGDEITNVVLEPFRPLLLQIDDGARYETSDFMYETDGKAMGGVNKSVDSVTVRVKNLGQEELEPTLITAVYGENTLEKVYLSPDNKVYAGEESLIACADMNLDAADKVKVMLINGLSNLTPMKEAKYFKELNK